MKINSFEDIRKIDANLVSLFQCSEREAVNWINAVEHGIKDWIGQHNKQYWEVVRVVSERRGILGRLRKDESVFLTRKGFATVLLKLCPDALKEGETVSALKSSMEQYPYVGDLRVLDTLHDGYHVKSHVKDVEDLLDNVPLAVRDDKECKPTPEDVVVAYLRREFEGRTNIFPQSRVYVRPQYSSEINPAISVETYMNQKFLDDNEPSSIIAFEFIDNKLQKEKLYELSGRYSGERNVKLFIVSSYGLSSDVRILAKNKNIGYVLLNPGKEMTSANYILPRSIEDYTKQRYDLEVLEGKHAMTTPFLIMDCGQVTSSMADVLSHNGVAVNSHRLMNIPYLTDDEIEKRADDLTKGDVEHKESLFRAYPAMLSDLSLDPFWYAGQRGLSFVMESMTDDLQLGRLEVMNNRAILNSNGLENYDRYRFTMAHELGHYILHAELFKNKGVVSVGESETTLSIGDDGSRRLEYQANKFASCLLMPRNLVLNLYVVLFNIHVTNKYGTSFRALYYNPSQPETWSSYNNIVGRMAALLGVSRQAMHIRLKTLGLLKTPD